MVRRMLAAGVLVLLLPVAARAQSSYCSAPAGYFATHCFGTMCEYTTNALYDGSIGPSLQVSTNGLNCAPLSKWPYYQLTSQPGTVPASLQVGPPAAVAPNPAPEISADDALTGLTLMAGLVLVGRGRRLTR
ncbi:MAG TPA: hypothetical protein VID71_10900 [Steroidobacteraceae bacterium]